MTKYKCGHESEILILDSNPLSISAYLEWSKTVGVEGDKSMCFKCWCDTSKQRKRSDNE